MSTLKSWNWGVRENFPKNKQFKFLSRSSGGEEWELGCRGMYGDLYKGKIEGQYAKENMALSLGLKEKGQSVMEC